MLEFRKIDYDKDLEEILCLIQKDLDEFYTLEHFKWKHLDNPFGKSYGYLALDKDKIVGVRMFMFWKFLNPNDKDELTAIRPVDTVVDRDYRGRGLFKKLTLRGIEECKSDYDLIFNTPNENSLPGYLKMGWQNIEPVDYFRLAVVNPFLKTLSFKNIDPGVIKFEDKHILPDDIISTFRSSEYFNWRYKDNNYKVAHFLTEEVYVAYSVSKEKYLVIYEILGDVRSISSKVLSSLALKNRKALIYFYNNEVLHRTSFLVTFKRRKPVVILKNHKELPSVKHIDFSLADLEAVF